MGCRKCFAVWLSDVTGRQRLSSAPLRDCAAPLAGWGVSVGVFKGTPCPCCQSGRVYSGRVQSVRAHERNDVHDEPRIRLGAALLLRLLPSSSPLHPPTAFRVAQGLRPGGLGGYSKLDGSSLPLDEPRGLKRPFE